jgi:hypothetical protein
VDVLEMPKGPERTPCATVVEMYLRRVRKPEKSKKTARGSIRTLIPDQKGDEAFR